MYACDRITLLDVLSHFEVERDFNEEPEQTIERLKGQSTVRRLVRIVGGYAFYSWTLILGEDDVPWVTALPGRVLRLSMLLFAFVSTSTYTANLAAFFTMQNVEVVGPQDMHALAQTIAYVPTGESAAMVHTHARARAHKRTHARKHASTRARAHTRTHTS